jgi:hypothetical protein
MNVRGNVKFSSDLTTIMKPHKTFKDPVDKIRVSNPEALMDTDFEYSLQSTKWESVEVQNNIPGIFQRANEPAYQGPKIVSIIKTELGETQNEAQVTVLPPPQTLNPPSTYLNGNDNISWNLYHRDNDDGRWENRRITLPFVVRINGIEYSTIYVSSHGFFTFEQTGYNYYSNLEVANRPPQMTVKLFNFRSTNSNNRYYDRGRLLRVGYRTIEIDNASGVSIRKFILRMNWNSYFPINNITGDANDYPEGAWTAETHFFENESYFEVHYERNYGSFDNNFSCLADGRNNTILAKWPPDGIANNTVPVNTSSPYEVFTLANTSFRIDFYTQNRSILKITVTEVQNDRAFYTGMPIILKQTNDPTYIDGSYLIVTVFDDGLSFAVTSKTPDDYDVEFKLNNDYTTIYTGGFFNSSSILYTSIRPVASTKDIEIVFPYPHSLFVNSKIYVVDKGIFEVQPWTGSHVISSVVDDYTVRYISNSLDLYTESADLHTLGDEDPVGSNLYPNQQTFLYVRNEGVSQHRFFDGGVQINPETNSPNTQIIRQTRKYFRYQSGKGIQFSSGILFSPNYDIIKFTINHDNGVYANDLYSIFDIIIETDQEHGFTNADLYREGALINIYGLTVTDGLNVYNREFRVKSISGPKTFTVSLLSPTEFSEEINYSDIYMNLTSNNINVTIDTINNFFVFNGELYTNYNYIGLEIGTYNFTGITVDHPLGFVINDTSKFEVTGTVYQGLEVKTIDGITMTYYTGDITVEVKGDFGIISYSCYNYGYMGGENRIKFRTDIINSNDIYTESRSYPPARILTNQITTISGYDYGNGKYQVTESSRTIDLTNAQTLYNDLDLMRNDLLTYSRTQVTEIRAVLQSYGYRLIATPTYNTMAERLTYQDNDITVLGRFNKTYFDSNDILKLSNGFSNNTLNNHPYMCLALFTNSGLVGIATMLFREWINLETKKLKDIFYPLQNSNNGHDLYTYVINADGTEVFDVGGSTNWNFSNNQQPGGNGYHATNRFSNDDGIWGFSIGRSVDGNAPGPAIRDYNNSYGIENYNASDAQSYYMWNNRVNTTAYAVYAFVRTEDYSGTIPVEEQITYSEGEGPGYNLFNDEVLTNYKTLSNSYDQTTGDYKINSVNTINGLEDIGDWIKIKLPNEINLTKYKLVQNTSFISNSPGKFKIYGSKDDLNWVRIVNKEDSLISYDVNNAFEEDVTTNATFNYFALVVTTLLGSENWPVQPPDYNETLHLDNWFLYGREIYEDNLLSDNINSYIQYEYKETLAEKFTNVSGWRLVRFLPDSSLKWYQATDNALGTDVYGIAYNLGNEWSVDFGTYDEMCFSTYSFSHWLYCTKTTVETNYDIQSASIIRSSSSNIPYSSIWNNRDTNPEEPWISVNDYNAITPNILYGENSDERHLELLSGHGGMCVWVRDSQDVNNDYTTYELTTSNPLECDILVVGGGGAGGYNMGGGGGGGGVGYLENVTLNGNYKIKVGRGGFSSFNEENYQQGGIGDGVNSSIIEIIDSLETNNLLEVAGGGSGACNKEGTDAGNNGGSGGGAAEAQSTAGIVTGNTKSGLFSEALLYGSNGKEGNINFAGGGGGAGGDNTNVKSKYGAPGYKFSITETEYYYAAGGGGASTSQNGGSGGMGGGGGGGSLTNTGGVGGINGLKTYNSDTEKLEGGEGESGGSSGSAKGGSGAKNTGSGGGGSAQNSASYLGGNGGSGVVIIKYKSISTTNREDLVSLPGIRDFSPGGIGRIELKQWNDACVRSGLFDYQNGMFFEYDGSRKLAVVKRDSTEQIAGRLQIDQFSTRLSGTNTKFTTQLDEGGYIVLKGDSYLITKIVSDTELYIAPGYKAQGFTNYKTVKTNETRIYQENFNLDKLDGNGPSGYNMNINKMQMIFIDYSWYGAGKIRFGIRVEDGDIIYFHELKQNNINTEAYMRSGNIPGRFEISTKSKLCKLQSEIPSNLSEPNANLCKILKEDKDKFPDRGTIIINNEYIQYEKGEDTEKYATLIFKKRNVKGRGELMSANINDTIISFNQNCSPSLSHWGVSCIMDGGFNVDKSYLFTATSQNYISINSDLQDTAILSIRLAPTVDYGIPGFFGVRNLINRSALALYSVGIGTSGASHIQCIVKINCESQAFQNNDNWLPTGNGSIAQYLDHSALTTNTTTSQNGSVTERVTSGDSVASFICEGGSNSYAATEQILTAVRELSNSILGGPNAYPDGPDTLTIFLRKISGSTTNAFARISWTEAQG